MLRLVALEEEAEIIDINQNSTFRLDVFVKRIASHTRRGLFSETTISAVSILFYDLIQSPHSSHGHMLADRFFTLSTDGWKLTKKRINFCANAYFLMHVLIFVQTLSSSMAQRDVNVSMALFVQAY